MELVLRECFSDPLVKKINFLNDFVYLYPEAISLGPGRPMDRFFRVKESLSAPETYIKAIAGNDDSLFDITYNNLGQYGPTNGFIGALIADQLWRDEKIHCKPDQIMITTGAQEAMPILLIGLFEPGRDVLLATDPTYVGMTALAKVLNIEIFPISTTPDGIDLGSLQEAIVEIRAANKVPRALYDVPDFHNPMSTSMPVKTRHELLQLATMLDFLIFEDNPDEIT